ncbi:MAG: M48 family metallopeptidase [Candidatus Schmidhempelia sp.]|nr:M48 family metallopeptidase [Candidatus Schmidhempelia sp.]
MLKKKSLIATLITFILSQPVALAANIQLPDIGTAAVATLSVGQEIEMGDYYLRMLRANAPLSYDPLINSYINQLGHKLVNKADSVQTPFSFFVMRSRVINAFAFFGGNVVIHSRLILLTDNESQLASVMAHEISHVTQRHLARMMEAQKNNSPYIWGAALGSILLALANPQAGMAAFTSTLAGSQQSVISFTQSNEQDADRVGMSILTKAGFDPYASADFLQKLADEARYSTKPPEMLLTHPLPNNRLSDIRIRANQLKRPTVNSSLDYYLAKIRLAIFSKNQNTIQLILNDYKQINTSLTHIALTYGQALDAYNQHHYDQAEKILSPLLSRDPNNVWFIDLMTDIDLKTNRTKNAVTRLQQALKINQNSQVLQLNLANAYLENNNLSQAATLLHRYTHQNNNDINGWELLGTAYSKQRLRGEEMIVQAEISALQGQFQQAIRLLTNAKSYLQNNKTLLARSNARITQLEQLQKRYAQYQH